MNVETEKHQHPIAFSGEMKEKIAQKSFIRLMQLLLLHREITTGFLQME